MNSSSPRLRKARRKFSARAATIDGARIIGFDQDLGTIEVGKLADLSVLDRNPLENIRNRTSFTLGNLAAPALGVIRWSGV